MRVARHAAVAAIVLAAAAACAAGLVAVPDGAGASGGATGFAAPPDTPARVVVEAALGQIDVTTTYDPSYVRIPYPGGDVPVDRGVCSDVVIRAFRAAGVDLQRLVHEDMRANFRRYPRRWGLSRPDPNIDHRRVPNLMVFFERRGAAVPVSADPGDYRAGDVVSWDLGGGVPHIGIVTGDVDPVSGRPRIVHNIGQGARLEDVVFAWTVTGHFRYFR